MHVKYRMTGKVYKALLNYLKLQNLKGFYKDELEIFKHPTQTIKQKDGTIKYVIIEINNNDDAIFNMPYICMDLICEVDYCD